MKRFLITGATGNIGFEVIRFLCKHNSSNKVIAAVRDIEKAKKLFKDFPAVEFRQFDFEDTNSFEQSLTGIDRVFLLRPPHISNIDKFFKPLLKQIKLHNIHDIVFLSVQGAEKSKVIPHNKIEKLLKEFGFNTVFLRPAYFMQNLITTLLPDIKMKRTIVLPAGKARFNWVDVENIGEMAAIVLDRFAEYNQQSFDITGKENASFQEVVDLINTQIDDPIRYNNVNPFQFFVLKRKEGMPLGMILVMISLHFLPRFQKEPRISDWYHQITGKQPTDLKSFIKRENRLFDYKL